MSIFAEITQLAKVTEGLVSASISFGRSQRESALEFRKEQLILLQELTKAGIDPVLFDLMLTTELDRKLKARLGIAFFISTICFTLLSFLIIILNSTRQWGIGQIAITALIIETPLQFIALLYDAPRTSDYREQACDADHPY